MASDLELQILDDLTIQAEGKNNIILSAKFRNILIVDDNEFSFSRIDSIIAWKQEFLSMPALIELQTRDLMHLNID
ncbi:hypothetical protein C7B77_23360 [Chamaesiphon polymorphus CCALA 037]|uniref:Uncharacterized protein n=1 Tax=Chamaesiphon polymorphus CCALA 037 TaxID=2107692 RepID=A0A2T1FXT1_9CYAN|nr:hypothetical protein C7B77_23360 [Chamaesiphon polymorphus CCALA 037]